MFNFDDLRFFLELARAERLVEAARRLGVDHTTVGRRIAALEERLQARVFDKSPSGYTLTEAGRALLPHAEAVEAEARAIMAQVAGEAAAPTGTVRTILPEAFGSHFLASRLAPFREQHPDIHLELVEETRHRSLSRRDADLAITLSRPRAGRLVAQKIGTYCLRLYGAPEYLKSRPEIRSDSDLADHDFIWFVDDHLDFEELRRIEKQARNVRIVLRSTSVTGQAQAALGGAGLAFLPCFLGDETPGLVRVLPETSVSTRDLWLVVHEDLRRVARVRAVADFLRQLVKKHSGLLTG